MNLDEFKTIHMINNVSGEIVSNTSRLMQTTIKQLIADYDKIARMFGETGTFGESVSEFMKYKVRSILNSERFKAIGNEYAPEELRQLSRKVIQTAVDIFADEYLAFVKAKDLKKPEDIIKALKAVEIYLTQTNYSEFCEKIYNKLREKENGL